MFIDNQLLFDYYRQFNAMKNASLMAHLMAWNIVYNNQSSKINNNDSPIQELSESEIAYVEAKNDENSIQFEINDDFKEFYKESLKYKLEKSM